MYGTREINRLDITMQPLIQNILSQIFDSSPYFLKDSVISLARIALGNKTKKLSHVHVNRVFGQKFPTNAKNYFECLKLN